MKVRMRNLLPISCLIVGGCVCTPSTPKPVTLRLKNTSRDTLFVDTTDQRLGMVVQRSVVGTYTSFVESPRCACLSCDNICSGACGCPEPTTRLVQRVAPDSVFERQWSGVVQISSTAACGGFGGTECLAPENAPYNETFNLHFCYALAATVTGQNADGGPVEGVLSSDQGCVDKTFRIDDGVVEVGPSRGADCVTTADCKGMGELCFSGACTASCPANTFPTEAEASLRIGIDDQGFFTVTRDGPRVTYTGSGTVGSASYNASSLRIFLTRQGTAGETLTGTLDIDVPRANHLGPLAVGQKIAVRVVDNSPSSRPTSNVGLTLRDDTGSVLVIADASLGQANLNGADVQPFAVGLGGQPIGCRLTGCGKELFAKTSFGDGMTTLSLEPGQSGNLLNANGTYRAVNLFSADYGPTGNCEIKTIRPFLIWRDKPPGG